MVFFYIVNEKIQQHQHMDKEEGQERKVSASIAIFFSIGKKKLFFQIGHIESFLWADIFFCFRNIKLASVSSLFFLINFSGIRQTCPYQLFLQFTQRKRKREGEKEYENMNTNTNIFSSKLKSTCSPLTFALAGLYHCQACCNFRTKNGSLQFVGELEKCRKREKKGREKS